MRHTFLFTTLALAMIPRMAEVDAGTAAPTAEPDKGHKSIVPKKYGNKYKNGGSDDLAKFINDQCKGKDGFEYTAFFLLCRKNGLDEAKVAHYETLVNDKAHGAQGRARMTLRNMLASVARKNGKLVGLDDTETEIAVAAAVVPTNTAKPADEQTATEGDAPTTDLVDDGEDA